MPCRCLPWVSAWMTTLSVLQSGCALVHLYANPITVSIVEMWWTIQEPTVLGVATARVAILAMPPSTRSSSDPLGLQTSPATWNPQASTDLMENGLMACLSFRGREGKCWCGMPLVQILWHHHTSLWHQERQVQWQRRPRRSSVLSMLIWRKATILCLCLYIYLHIYYSLYICKLIFVN